MVKVPVRPQTFGKLHAESRPSLPGQPEAIPWVFYDTQTYISGTTTELTFFQVTNVDRTISNMPNAGQLPDPQYFQWYYWGCDILLDASVDTGNDEAGAIDDVAKLLFTGRGIATFTLSDKVYGPFPQSFLHASGGPTGFASSTFTPPVSIQYANNGVFDGGFSWGGAITISPKEGFVHRLNWSAAQTLQAGNTDIRLWMLGLLSRKVQ